MTETNWTKEEFKAYLLSYAASADYFESKEEKATILSYVSKDIYKKVHLELKGDNDYQSIQKILFTLDKYNYSKDDLNVLFEDIKTLFEADGKFDVLEENMMHALRRLIK